MLTIKFSRTENGIYISHVDILRALNRTFRRAGIEVAYSKGFNRHMNLFLTQPLPFGIASYSDYVTVDTVEKVDEIYAVKVFNENCPDFLKAEYAKNTLSPPNLSAKVSACAYHISNVIAMAHTEQIYALRDVCVLEYEKNGERVSKDVTGGIIDVLVDENGIDFILSFGENNVRIDLICEDLNKKYNLGIKNTDIYRTEQYIKDGEEIISADEYLKNLL